MPDHDSLHELTMGDAAAVCDVLPSSTSGMDVEQIFDAEPERDSVVVRSADGTCVLIGRGDFYQHLTGRLGYGYALHRRRPVLGMELRHAPTFDASVTVVQAGLSLIERGEVAGTPVVLVQDEEQRVGTISTQEVLGHLGRSFHRKVDELESSDRRFRSMLANANEVICLVGSDGVVLWVSETVRAVLGRDPAAVVGSHIDERLVDHDKWVVEAMLRQVLAVPGEHVSGDATVVDGFDRARTVEFHVTNLLEDPAMEAIVVNIRDVTDRRQLESRLRHEALHDPLTGLPNRAMFSDSLNLHLASTSLPVAVAFVDLDGFKEVNDTLGHACGDAVLTAVATAIRGVVRAEDLVARLGGDEFGLLMVDDGGPSPMSETVRAVVDRVLEAASRPLAIAGERIMPAASIGIAFADTTRDGEQLLQRADVAMYQAKATGRNRASWWDEQMHESVVARHLVARQLADAVRGDQLHLLYQPLVQLPGNRTVGYEALLRWNRPGHGTVAPGQFIAIAEETKAILSIGAWVLLKACTDAVAWDPGPDGPGISVNLSARQLENDDIVHQVADVLARTRLPASRLELELTETAMMQRLDSVAPKIQAIRGLGVSVAIDDFGVGYSSLAQLRGLPVDCVKVDRSFVSALGTSDGDRALVTGIVGLARALRLSIVAEGVETAEQAAMVSELGCERAQGFFYSEPIDAARVQRAHLGRSPASGADSSADGPVHSDDSKDLLAATPG